MAYPKVVQVGLPRDHGQTPDDIRKHTTMVREKKCSTLTFNHEGYTSQSPSRYKSTTTGTPKLIWSCNYSCSKPQPPKSRVTI